MATKIQQIVTSTPSSGVLLSSWLQNQYGVQRSEVANYVRQKWLVRVADGVYKVAGSPYSLFGAVASLNEQMKKQCTVGAGTALELRGYAHYLPMGKPIATLMLPSTQRLPEWVKKTDWDRTVQCTSTSFLGDDLLGVEPMTIEGMQVLVSSPERAIMECLNDSNAKDSLLDIYYTMESLTTLRPRLVQQLLEKCTSKKVKRLFLYMAEKAGHTWLRGVRLENIDLGKGRLMLTPRGKYVSKYSMTIPTDLFEYE